MQASTCLALGAAIDLPQMYWLAPVGALAALLTALGLSRSVMARPEGEGESVRIARAVREGAAAYLGRQSKVIAAVFVLLTLALVALWAMGLQPALSAVGVPIAGALSALCGWLGMRMATHAAARTALAAKHSLADGLTVAFRAGAVMGLIVVGFALLDASLWFFILTRFGERLGLSGDLRELTTVMLGYGMGASTQALFARVGGGIYTKAADVGADLVGKVEAGVPEDDPRNPATIADNVGDNVGDVAGMGADLYESYYGSVLATMALGAAAAYSVGHGAQTGETANLAMLLAVAPLAIAGAGILSSIIGVFAVRAREGATFIDLLAGLQRGVYIAAALIVAGAFAVLYALMGTGDIGLAAANAGVRWWGIALAIVFGLVAGLVIAAATERATSYEHPTTRRIAMQAVTGPATVIIAGLAAGMRSVAAAVTTVVVAIIASFIAAGGGEHFLMGLYGVGIASVGMLATLGVTLATDAYGPIADNAGGNAQMSGEAPEVRRRTDMLDALGNTTAATGKGFAIGSAALTALALFAAYIQVVQSQISRQGEAFARSFAYAATVPKETRDGPHAVYQGHGRFAIVIPGGERTGATRFDGAVIDRSLAEAHDVEHLERGMTLALVEFEAGHAHAEHLDEEERDRHYPPSWRLADSRRLTVSGEAQHEGHVDRFDLPVIAARNATLRDVLACYDVSFMSPRALGGLFLGVMLTFLFCALTTGAVGRAASRMMCECRRQFAVMRDALRAKRMPEAQIADLRQWPLRIEHEGVSYPDYTTCVRIATAGAQREMIAPALLAIVAPIGVGLLLDVPGVVGLLAGGLTSGFAMAIFMANAGGAWDNAKKLIESHSPVTADEFLDDVAKHEAVPTAIRDAIENRAVELRREGRGSAIVYGKGSDIHKAAIVGDTVGDPFKDAAGPSLNILIKLISIVSVVFAGLIVRFGPAFGEWIGLP